jgi:hypothetical protein
LSNNNRKRNKTDVRIDTELDANREEYKSMVDSPTKYPNVKNKTDMIDYLLNLDSIMNRQRQRSENQLIEEEDSKIENSNLFSDLVNKNKKVANRNLLELNEYKEQSSNASQSWAKYSSRQSLTVSESEQLETKEGWLLKRSYKSPMFLGWQRRYWVIKNQRFVYYKEQDKKTLDGVIDFNLLTCLITVPKALIESEMPGMYLLDFILLIFLYFLV